MNALGKGADQSAAGTRGSRLRRLSKTGWPKRFPVAQFPNAPLAAAFAGMVAERLTEGRARSYAHAVVSVGLGIWAYGELTEGVNWFRRLLGAAGLAYVLVRLAMALDS